VLFVDRYRVSVSGERLMQWGSGVHTKGTCMIEIRQFFDEYSAAFYITPAAIAEFYSAPCITARMGTAALSTTRQDTAAFFASVLEKYRGMGWTRGEIMKLESWPLGVNSVLATVRWAYQDDAGKTLWEWTFSYNLYRIEGTWKILLQTKHDDA
jgi:hypothetical protein